MMATLVADARAAVEGLGAYYVGLGYFLLVQGAGAKGGGGYDACPVFREDARARVQVYSLALIMRLWDLPHYRQGTFRQDMEVNLRNVAVPGTGLPLSLFPGAMGLAEVPLVGGVLRRTGVLPLLSRALVLLVILALNPLLCLLGALHKAVIDCEIAWWKETQGDVAGPLACVRRLAGDWPLLQRLLQATCRYFVEHLLHPPDWFSFWRLNCRLASYHAYITRNKGYRMEDKWTFLQACEAHGIPITPYLDLPCLIVKNKNEEGGLGFYRFFNATEGGDWIIQERVDNDEFVSSLLPEDAPLSTMRVITASTWSARKQLDPKQSLKSTSGSTSTSTSTVAKKDTVEKEGEDGEKEEQEVGEGVAQTADGDVEEEALSMIRALSCVFRAGRAGAATDHSSILFDTDVDTGEVRFGTTNAHWYQLGASKIRTTPWVSEHNTTHHPDCDNVEVTGKKFSNMAAVVDLVTRAHAKLLPDVPIVGWDVAHTETGLVLLEVNLSCNFFRATFDVDAYVDFVDDYFRLLDRAWAKQGQTPGDREATAEAEATTETPVAVPVDPTATESPAEATTPASTNTTTTATTTTTTTTTAATPEGEEDPTDE